MRSSLFLVGLAHRVLADISQCKLAAPPNVDLSLGFTSIFDGAPSTGALNGYMLFVDFPDYPALSGETPESLRDVFLPDAADWYETASFGRLTLNMSADTSRFYRMPATADSYGWKRGLTFEAHQEYIQDAIEVAGLDNIPADVDVLYITTTANAAAISFSVSLVSEVVDRDSKQHVARRAVTFGVDVYKTWHARTLNHETGHAMGLPDLYPYSGGATGLYVGGWDIMGLISGASPDYFGWSKWWLGWLDDAQVACVAAAAAGTPASVTLSPIEVQGGTGHKMVVVTGTNNTQKVLVAEVRSSNRGVNSGLATAGCATGVLLYTVDVGVSTGNGPIRVLDSTPGSGGCDGDELNDAALVLDAPGRPSSFAFPEFGVVVSLIGKTDDDIYELEVAVL
ncbi:uncharacterized protein B0I36DRAFT_334505 [Microdochium trichocladiopsis]|uniref:M6 metalloprotease n=1 Tax=Microdochium trichocladiopsis TaxID=1682393 RepID=A0A9P8XWH7_9PEZI|nr:uncharacterized protein B0I36DRAFT_334505 [Microdochium trichocladiopsis]KAH7021470.1 hypothetical protein B0I36DRAFT_334505 [Microdochium trichocladiopsis]